MVITSQFFESDDLLDLEKEQNEWLAINIKDAKQIIKIYLSRIQIKYEKGMVSCTSDGIMKELPTIANSIMMIYDTEPPEKKDCDKAIKKYKEYIEKNPPKPGEHTSLLL